MSEGLIAFVVVFVLMFILEIRIPFGMMCASLAYFLIEGVDLKIVAQLSSNYLYTSFVLLSIPMFIFAANIMNEGDITERVFGVAKGLVGRFYGGMAHVNVLGSLIFSGMTGSAIADAAGLGKMEIAAMHKEGYDDGFSCAMTASSAVIGPTFPPSIPLVIYSMVSGASVGALFMGGVVPGALLAVALMVYVALVAKRRGYPRSDKVPFMEYIVYLFKSLPALMTPVILLLGIYTGFVTITEAGALAGAYALIVAVIGYHNMDRKKFVACVKDTIATTSTVALCCGAAAAINYMVAKEQIAVRLAEFLINAVSDKDVFLLMINIIVLVLGMFIDCNVVQLVFVPLIVPIAQKYGIDLVHLGLILCYNMMIGLVTPPYGGLLFVTSSVSGTPLKDVIKEIWLPLIAMLVVLFAITYIPDLVLFFPRFIMGYGA